MLRISPPWPLRGCLRAGLRTTDYLVVFREGVKRGDCVEREWSATWLRAVTATYAVRYATKGVLGKGVLGGYVMRAVGLRMMVRLRRSVGLPAVLAGCICRPAAVMMQIGV